MNEYIFIPDKEQPPNFVFVHIPKTGGTTFRKLVIRKLKGVRHFRENVDRYKINRSSWYKDYYNKVIDYKPRYKIDKDKLSKFNVISGHFTASKYLFLKYPIITWVRNPTDRLISHYYNWLEKYNHIDHYKDKDKLVWYKYFKDGMDLVEFSKAFGNHMSFFFDIDFNKFKFIGVLEHYNESLQLFGKLFNLKIPVVDIKLNSLKYPIISKDIREKIEKNQSDDFELYYKSIDNLTNLYGKL